MNRFVRVAPAIAAVLGVVADAATTQWCLTIVEGCVEGNPISVRLFELLGGLWPTAALLCIALVAVSWPLWFGHSLSRSVTVVAWVSLAVFSLLRWEVVATNLGIWAQAN